MCPPPHCRSCALSQPLFLSPLSLPCFLALFLPPYPSFSPFFTHTHTHTFLLSHLCYMQRKYLGSELPLCGTDDEASSQWRVGCVWCILCTKTINTPHTAPTALKQTQRFHLSIMSQITQRKCQSCVYIPNLRYRRPLHDAPTLQMGLYLLFTESCSNCITISVFHSLSLAHTHTVCCIITWHTLTMQ